LNCVCQIVTSTGRGYKPTFGVAIDKTVDGEHVGEGVISIAEMKKSAKTVQRLGEAITYSVVHEAGHLGGLTHCRNSCVMEPTASVNETLRVVSELGGFIFCNTCVEDYQ
jgi:predicted Zn-dependent protease